MFDIKAPTAQEWEQDNEWDPQVHLTGSTDDGEITAFQNLIDKNSDRILAHHLYSPLPGAYSLEIQFSDERTADEFLKEIRRVKGRTYRPPQVLERKK